MSAEESTAVAELESSGTTGSSLADEYVGEAPGEDEVLESAPPGDDTGEEANAAEEETKPADEQAAAVEEPAFPEELVEQAKRIGYDEPEKFGTKENLQYAVDQFNQQMSSLGRSTMKAPAEPAAKPAAPVAPMATAPVVQSEIPELKEFGEELEPEVREPLNRLVQRHKAVEAHQKGRMDALQATVDRLEQQGFQQARAEISNRVDSFIAGLPEGYAEHLGKGSRSQLGFNSAAVQARAEIDQEIEVMIAGYGVSGRDLPSEGDLLMAAMRNVLGSKNDSIIQKQTAAQVQKRQKQATARPAGQKSTRQQTDAAKATEAIDKAWANTGLPEGDAKEIF